MLERELEWRALWTRSNCEQLAFDQLAAKGFQPFLPRIQTWSVRAGRPHRIAIPMFPGYLFLRGALDQAGYGEVRKTRGLVGVLGELPADQIAAIEHLARVELPMRPHPFLREGDVVRIHHGPLAGLEGILVRFKPNKLLLVVCVELLRRSVAVEVDCAFVDAA